MISILIIQLFIADGRVSTHLKVKSELILFVYGLSMSDLIGFNLVASIDLFDSLRSL